MMYTIISLLAILIPSQANRLLLQALPAAPAAPITPGVPPAAPLPAAPAPPAPPAAPATPVSPAMPPAPPATPATPGAPAAIPPATGYPPATVPGAPGAVPPTYPGMPGAYPVATAPPGVGYPGQVPPATGYPGTMPMTPATPGMAPGAPGAAPGGVPPLPAIPALPLTPPQPFMELNCVVPHGGFGSCAGKPNNVINPPMNFKVNCAAYGGCYGSTINMDFNSPVGPPGWQNQFAFGMPGVDYQIEGVWASEPYALAYGTVNIRNHGGPGSNNVVLENMECSNIGSCNGLTINLWGASVNDMHCDMPSYCMGCVIVDHGTIPPQAKPCWGY